MDYDCGPLKFADSHKQPHRMSPPMLVAEQLTSTSPIHVWHVSLTRYAIISISISIQAFLILYLIQILERERTPTNKEINMDFVVDFKSMHPYI